VDLEMLASANKAIVATGSDDIRSHSMDEMLRDRSTNGFVRGPRQVLLASNNKPSMRLDSMLLPVVPLVDDPQFLRFLFKPGLELNLLIAIAQEAGKLLSTPTQDADNSGSVLRNAHQAIYHHLALHCFPSPKW
jgi:hypothetical protein